MDLSNTIKNGIMYLRDNDNQIWSPHFFVLTQNQLLYTEMTDQPEQQDESEGDDEDSTSDDANAPEKPVVILLTFLYFIVHGLYV